MKIERGKAVAGSLKWSTLVWVFHLILFSPCYGQQVTILDEDSSKPIYNVSVIPEGSGKVLFSDVDGVLDISSYVSYNNFIFRHPSYQQQTISLNALKERAFRVAMTERIISIDEVVISANKWEQDKSEVPNEILTISPKEISYNNPQTSADVLRQTGQVFVQKSQLGGGSPMLRGFAANRVLIVVDGVRMNNAIFRSGNLQNVISIDPNILESAEVVFGPGSVIYGSDALGGVMDFHTAQPSFTTKSKPQLAGTAFSRYSSANAEKTGHVDVKVSGKKLSFLTSLSYSDFDDLRTGSRRNANYPDFGKRPIYAERVNGQDRLTPNDNENIQRFSGYNQWSTINKLRYRVNNDFEVGYGYYLANTSDIPRYDRLIQDNGHPDSLRNAEWYYGPQKWNMHHFTLSSYSRNWLFDEARLTSTLQRFEESRNDRRFGNPSLRQQIETVDVTTLNLDFDKSIGRNNFYYGAEYTDNRVESVASRTNIITGEITNIASRYPNGGSDYRTIALYASYKVRFNEKWVLNTGLRFSNIRLTAKTTDANAALFGLDQIQLNNEAFSGSIGLVYKPKETLQFNALVASGFRSPNVDDVGKVFELDDDIVVAPNTALSPEFSYNGELGLQWEISDKLRIGSVVYYSLLRDAIVRGPFEINGSSTINIDGVDKEIRAQVNADQAYIYGGSVNLSADFTPNLSLVTSFTITKGRDKTNDEPLRHTAPNFGKTSVIYQKNKLRSELYIEYNGKKLRADIPTSEIDDKDFLYANHATDNTRDGTPAWHTFNLRSSYKFSKIFELSIAVENIMDVHYRPYSSGISAPGRNFITSIRASF